MPVPTILDEAFLQRGTSGIERWRSLTHALFFKHLDQYRHANVRSMNAYGTRKLDHFDQFRTRCTRAKRRANVLRHARRVKVSRGRAGGDRDKRLYLVLEMILLRRHCRERHVRLEEADVEAQQALPAIAPRAVRTREFFLRLLLPLRQGNSHGFSPPRSDTQLRRPLLPTSSFRATWRYGPCSCCVPRRANDAH